MAKFIYRVRRNNETQEGTINAQNIESAAKLLERQGYSIIEIKEEQSIYTKNAYAPAPILTVKEKKEFFNSFYFLFKSGLSFLEICSSASKSAKNENIQIIYNKISKSLEKGNSIEDTFKKYSNSIGYTYAMLVVAGEKSGKLEEILLGILGNIKKQEDIKNNIRTKSTYPLILLCLAISVGLLYLFFFNVVFSKITEGITAQAAVGLLVSALFKILIIYLIVAFIGFSIYKNKALINAIVEKIMNLKMFKKVLNSYYFSNFFSVFSLAFGAGLTIIESTELANSTINSKEINKKINEANERIKEGCELSTALNITQLFNDFAISQTATGEKSGEIEKMLKAIALDYEKELDTNLKIMLKSIEPAMTLLVGIFVAIILAKGYMSYYNSLFSLF